MAKPPFDFNDTFTGINPERIVQVRLLDEYKNKENPMFSYGAGYRYVDNSGHELRAPEPVLIFGIGTLADGMQVSFDIGTSMAKSMIKRLNGWIEEIEKKDHAPR